MTNLGENDNEILDLVKQKWSYPYESMSSFGRFKSYTAELFEGSFFPRGVTLKCTSSNLISLYIYIYMYIYLYIYVYIYTYQQLIGRFTFMLETYFLSCNKTFFV